MKQFFQKLAGIIAACFVTGLVLSACTTSRAAQEGNDTNIATLLQERRFEFVPQTVIPTGGRTQQLTGDFFLRVTPDTIQSYLPYFGRAFTAPMTPGQGSMDFTITDFEYTTTPGSRDRQDIVIRPRQGTDVREMLLRVFPNGNASLQALSNNRQQISYNGIIRRRR